MVQPLAVDLGRVKYLTRPGPGRRASQSPTGIPLAPSGSSEASCTLRGVPGYHSRRHLMSSVMKRGCCLGSGSDPATHLRLFLLPILKSRHIKPDWASKDVLPRNAEAEEVRSGRIRNVRDYVHPQLRSPCLHSWRSSEVRIFHCNDAQSTHDLQTPSASTHNQQGQSNTKAFMST
jgi:hypothetical protein